jgi:DNA-binding GntR family transcriptional regulator
VRSELPPYLRVSADLRRKIREGELLPGEQLPSLDRISADYGISRATAQKAVRVLIDEGLAVSRPRWGVFVKQR